MQGRTVRAAPLTPFHVPGSQEGLRLRDGEASWMVQRLSGGGSELGLRGCVSTWGLCHLVACDLRQSPRLGAASCCHLWKGRLPHCAAPGDWAAAEQEPSGHLANTASSWGEAPSAHGGRSKCRAPGHRSRPLLALACGGGNWSLTQMKTGFVCVMGCVVERAAPAFWRLPIHAG